MSDRKKRPSTVHNVNLKSVRWVGGREELLKPQSLSGSKYIKLANLELTIRLARRRKTYRLEIHMTPMNE